ncbi:MAG: FIST C-terminal domain-containing protein [Bacteriovoracaceae bacterium]|nr:FIST C-terminal domain-containing protein [Bacteriovoracaceae bacterium]
MELKTFYYIKESGWSSSFPDLDSEQTLVFVFGAEEYLRANEKISDLVQVYPKSHFVGCSSAGEIFNQHILDGTLTVATIHFSKTNLKVVSAPILFSRDSFDVGKDLAKRLYQSDLVGVMIFSDGLHVNGTQLVRGMNTFIPNNISLTGGLAGDSFRFKETWVLQNRKPATNFITAVGFYGQKVHIAHGSKGGWDIFGPERIITRSKDNILYELDGQPALKLYKEYLGEKASELPASGLLFPLQIRTGRNDEKKVVRTILAVDEAEQFLTFAGDVPEGSLAQLMKANFDRLIEGASEAASSLKDILPPMLVIAISCMGRRLVLGERTEEETEAILDILPKGAQQIGFYSYGEISPYKKGNTCDFHNQTMTITAISEDS